MYMYQNFKIFLVSILTDSLTPHMFLAIYTCKKNKDVRLLSMY